MVPGLNPNAELVYDDKSLADMILQDPDEFNRRGNKVSVWERADQITRQIPLMH
jgi:hypothetical protein